MAEAPRPRVLIVDDEPLILEVLSEHFKAGCDVETAINGADALGEITGVITTDEILERIFSEFCIGK